VVNDLTGEVDYEYEVLVRSGSPRRQTRRWTPSVRLLIGRVPGQVQSCGHGRYFCGRRQSADFDQFEAERFEFSEDAIECGLVGELTRQGRFVAAVLDVERGERGADRLTQAATDADSVTLRQRIMVPAGHGRTALEAAHLLVVGLGVTCLMMIPRS
jgi:hypothetical protein